MVFVISHATFGFHHLDCKILFVVQLEENLLVTVLTPLVHGLLLHPQIHPGQDATPVLSRSSMLNHERAYSIEVTPQRPVSEGLHQVLARYDITIVLLLLPQEVLVPVERLLQEAFL